MPANMRFADLLDAVEHRGETFTVVRRGKTVATISPVRAGTMADLRRIFEEHPLDEDFERDVTDGLRAIGQSPRDAWND